MSINRRGFLYSPAGAWMTAAGCRRSPVLPPVVPPSSLPAPNNSGIDHIVVLTMENRSFDHLLGWLPNVNGTPPGLRYPDPHGTQHAVHSLARDYTGCGHPDPDHSYGGGRTCYANGAMNGFLLNISNDVYCIGHYDATDIPF